MTQERPSKPQIAGGKKHLVRTIFSKWPLLVWAVMAALAWQLSQRSGQSDRIQGIVKVLQRSVAPLEDGILLKVAPQGTKVKPGDVIAEFDTSHIDTEIEALLESESFENLDRRRKFQTNYTDQQIELQKAAAQKAALAAELTVANQAYETALMQYSKTPPLVLKSKVDAAKAELDSVTERARSNGESIKELETIVAEAKAMLDELGGFDKPGPNGANGAKGTDGAGSSKALQRLKQRRAQKMIVADYAGEVFEILHHPGEVVPAAEPIATIIVDGAHTVQALVNEADGQSVEKDQPVWIAAAVRPDDHMEGKVTYVAPTMSSLRDSSSAIAGRTILRRQITCEFTDAAEDLIGGQEVIVYLQKPSKFDFWPIGRAETKSASN